MNTLGKPCAYCGAPTSQLGGMPGQRRILGRVCCWFCAEDYEMAVGSWGGTADDRALAGAKWGARRGVAA